MTRLTTEQVDQLILASLHDRYPLPSEATRTSGSDRRLLTNRTIFLPQTRFCPDCLAGARIADHILQGGEPAEVREHLRALLPTSTRKASRSLWGFASPERQPHALQASLPLSRRSFERSPGRAANPKPAVT